MDLSQTTLLLEICFSLLLFFYGSFGYDLDEMGKCEPIRIDMCSHLKYDKTRMPNDLGHASQEEALSDLRPYSQLVNLFNCSTHIKFFLCSLFVPMCSEQINGPLVVNVCRSMCLQVKNDCEPVLQKVKVPWPMNCSRLPEPSGKEHLCMAPNQSWSSSESGSSATPNPVLRPPGVTRPGVTSSIPTAQSSLNTCPKKYVQYENSTCSDVCDPACKDCVPQCDDIMYTEQHKSFAYAWMAIWASLCIASTMFTIITFCIDPNRFRYPTRPVIFMAFSYLMYALAYFIPLFIPSKDIICKSDTESQSVMIVNGMESTLCIIIFLIQYYSGIASHIWWLVLTLTWYLAASRKWGLEAINSIACYFHLFAWAVPAVLTIAILVTGRVDSNELTGMCYVGNHDKWSLLIYVIIPLCFLLLLGQIFLLAGFVSLLRIRNNLKTQIDNTNIRKLEKLMAKIGVFAILYTVPAVCVLGSYVHEFINMDTWQCLSAGTTGDVNVKLQDSIPTVEIHMLKIFMSLVIGISISIWVLSSKTLKSCEQKCCSKANNSRVVQSKQRPYRKQASYVVAQPTDCNGYVQRYKFPARHSSVLASNHQHQSRNDAVSL